MYILVDRCDSEGFWGVYVGKAPSGVKDRIRTHLRNKDTWYRALLVQRDTTHGFNSAQIGWLEGRLYDLLKASDGARLSNKVRPGDETLAPAGVTVTISKPIPSMLTATTAVSLRRRLRGLRPAAAPGRLTARAQRRRPAGRFGAGAHRTR